MKNRLEFDKTLTTLCVLVFFIPMDSWHVWKDILNCPKYVTAPMVDCSELPFRLLTRLYGSQLCYTPMLHSKRFVLEAKYRRSSFSTCSIDHPLSVQFCSNNAKDFSQAASHVIKQCEIVDLNLGCPQKIAKRGNYGAYIMDDWILIDDIIRTAIRELDCHISCKIRIYPNDPFKTIQYAKLLENAGCKVLTVHGRGIEQKGALSGLADWDMINLVKQNISIPLIANGNILRFEDISEALENTQADAIMSAEAILNNPALFSNLQLTTYEIGTQFLDLCQLYPISLNHIRGHLFKIFHLCLPLLPDLRKQLCLAQSLTDFRSFIDGMRKAFEPRQKQIMDDPIFTPNYELEQQINCQKLRMRQKLSPYKQLDEPIPTLNECMKNISQSPELAGYIDIPPWICHSVPHHQSSADT